MAIKEHLFCIQKHTEEIKETIAELQEMADIDDYEDYDDEYETDEEEYDIKRENRERDEMNSNFELGVI